MLHTRSRPVENDSALGDAPATLELVLPVPEGRQDPLVAVLATLGFDRFWQQEAHLRAYVPAARWGTPQQERLERRLSALGVEDVPAPGPVGEENWNTRWEADLAPVRAGPFVIAPTSAALPADADPSRVLRIDPQMSFGTGHHESTRLALRLLAGPAPRSQHVLDAGTGTGVLAIAAVRLGAAHVVAFDADGRVLRNAAENTARNGVAEHVALRAGTLGEVVPEGGFDLILANINRSALLDLLPAFREKMAPGGRVVLAGLLRDDRPVITGRAAACGFVPEEEQTENEWWAVCLRGRT